MAATSAASSSSPSWSALGAKEKAKLARKAFEIRARLRAGLPVTDDERRYVEAYDNEPSRRKIRRQLNTPSVKAPPVTPVSPSVPPGSPAQEPTPSADASSPADGVGDLPPLAVPVDVTEAPKSDAVRAKAETSARFIVGWMKALNEENAKAGAIVSAPPEVAELLFEEAIYPCIVGTISRRGGLSFTPQQEDWVSFGTGAAVLVGAAERKSRQAKLAAQAPRPDPSAPKAQDAAPPPEPQKTTSAEPDRYEGL